MNPHPASELLQVMALASAIGEKIDQTLSANQYHPAFGHLVDMAEKLESVNVQVVGLIHQDQVRVPVEPIDHIFNEPVGLFSCRQSQ